MDDLCTRSAHIAGRITDCERASGRAAGSVRLLLVSKGQPAETVRRAWLCGNAIFGENYLQEAFDKMGRLSNLPLEWHFLGPLQSNKTRGVSEHFSWVHSINRLKIAHRLNDQRPEDLPPLQVCLQINVSGETSKSGLRSEQVLPFAERLHDLKRLQLRGLMTIGAAGLSYDEQRDAFAKLRASFDQLNAEGHLCDTLSMGMSGDYPAAIAEGATLVRIGEAAFGPRR